VAKRTASAKKQARSGVKRAARNRGVRSEVKTMVVKARRSMTEASGGDSDRRSITLDAMRALDRAASKGVLHRNNASRRKARLARQMAKLAIAPAPAPKSAAAAGGKGKKASAAPAAPAAPAKAPAGKASGTGKTMAAAAPALAPAAPPASAKAAPKKK
jgi:small subunit ribosomal protein S20